MASKSAFYRAANNLKKQLYGNKNNNEHGISTDHQQHYFENDLSEGNHVENDLSEGDNVENDLQNELKSSKKRKGDFNHDYDKIHPDKRCRTEINFIEPDENVTKKRKRDCILDDNKDYDSIYSNKRPRTQFNIIQSDNDISLKDKVKNIANKNAKNLTRQCLEDFLGLLRSLGHVDLPKSASTLLETARCGKDYEVSEMEGTNDPDGQYVYLGIQKNLETLISPSTYKEEEIDLLINVDGVEIYKDSSESMWTILMSVSSKKHEKKVVPIAFFLWRLKTKMSLQIPK